MTTFAALAGEMDAAVDTRLGDWLDYARAGQPAAGLPAFVMREDRPAGIDAVAEAWVLKVAVERLPDGPSPDDRFTCTTLPGTWAPTGAYVRDASGRYWLADIERAA